MLAVVPLAVLLASASPEPTSTATASYADTGSTDYRETVRYDLEARLDAEARTVTGAGRLRWTNLGSRPERELWWHLYLNAFANDRSTFMRESDRGRLRGDVFDREHWGGIEVTRMAVADPTSGASTDLLSARTFEQPDDGNVHDRTLMRTPLPFAVEPGETVEIELAFTSQLPKVFARTGFSGSFVMVAQWFPKIAAHKETWNAHQYHATSEFFADYGTFHVAIDVPEDHVVGATGVRVATERTTPGRATYVYDAERVHDFAWTADPRFVEVTRTFVADEETTLDELEAVAARLGVAPGEVKLDDVEVRLLIQPEHEQYAERYFAAIFAAIERFGLWYGAYPYPALTVVDGPRGASGAMGMEYPTLVTGGVRWPSPDGTASPESVTIHEYGHQYWYGLVGSNEFEEAWLDEGFDTYSTGKVVDEVYGGFALVPRLLGVPLTPWFSNLRFTHADIARIGSMAGPDDDAVVRTSWAYRSATSYGLNNYPRAALVLLQLENVVGEATLLRAMRLYAQRWRYRHPTTQDFVRVVEELHGAPLDDFFVRALHTPDGVDYGIESLKSVRRKVAAGVFDDRTVTKEEAEEDAEEEVYDTTIVARRYTSIDVPVSLRVTFEDGTDELVVWDGVYRWKRFDFETRSKATSARLHPYDGQALDLKRANDSRRVTPSHGAAVTWGATALYVVQTLWQLLGGVL